MVLWEDSNAAAFGATVHFDQDYEPAPVLIYSIGHVVRENDHAITLAMDFTDRGTSNQHHRHLQTIVKSGIKNIRRMTMKQFRKLARKK